MRPPRFMEEAIHARIAVKIHCRAKKNHDALRMTSIGACGGLPCIHRLSWAYPTMCRPAEAMRSTLPATVSPRESFIGACYLQGLDHVYIAAMSNLRAPNQSRRNLITKLYRADEDHAPACVPDAQERSECMQLLRDCDSPDDGSRRLRRHVAPTATSLVVCAIR